MQIVGSIIYGWIADSLGCAEFGVGVGLVAFTGSLVRSHKPTTQKTKDVSGREVEA
jgi:hypothetical protein